ncbi:transducin family protein/WD-40 repeat family protein [Abeliophyllum distichum]|uniref:Transducin family protein/WD-40 repeat family protein n=1 Tax=Abeliophyllum distichum TaxID=126358 RepID=A0ABD1P8V6_9LAMI
MATDIATLEKRYFDVCKRQGILPNKAIVAELFKAKLKKAHHEVSSFVVLLDDLKDVDFFPLLDLLMEIDSSEIDAIDMINRSSCALSGEHVSSLLRAVNKKLRVVDIRDISFGKDFLLDLSQRGLTCQVLNLRSSHFRKLNMVGKFVQMRILNLDFSASLTSFREDCFTCMPNLKSLSLCETRIANLWTTSAALSKLPALVELRFQNCLLCSDTRSSPVSSWNKVNDGIDSSQRDFGLYIELPSLNGEAIPYLHSNVEDEDINDYDANHDVRSTTEDSSDDSEVDFSGHCQDFGLVELLPDLPPGWNELVDLQNEISFGTLDMQDEDPFSSGSSNSRHMSYIAPKKYVSHHPSPICYEKHYRDYMIASLPNLKILDNLHIQKVDREIANDIFRRHFEYLPYNMNNKESVVSILQKRELRANPTRTHTSKKKFSYASRKAQHFYSRSLSAAKAGSSAWPTLRPLSISGSVSRDERRSFRPRQFEYHPSDSSLMVFGTLDGEVVVVNHESEKIVSYIPSLGAMNSVLGLCWLKKYPSKLIAGSDNGSLRLYDIKNELFLASGYSKHVALYDISSGRRLQDVKLWDLRQKPNQPCYTASSSRGNVMVCFSPDDHYLLVSAIDNEVKQLLAVDGRLHLDFAIASTGRSCCARTGRRLRDVSLEGKGSGTSMFVQSLRGDPFRDFNMSILAAYIRPSSNSEIVKVNLLASSDHDKVHSYTQQSHISNGLGG